MSVDTASALQAFYTDLSEADAALEQAINATDPAVVSTQVSECLTWLSYSQANAALAGDVDDAQAAAQAVSALSAVTVPTDPAQLLLFQAEVLYPFHATIASLLTGPANQELHDANWDFYALMAALFTVVGGIGYIDWKQTHGGYPREPAAQLTPVYSYRYRR